MSNSVHCNFSTILPISLYNVCSQYVIREKFLKVQISNLVICFCSLLYANLMQVSIFLFIFLSRIHCQNYVVLCDFIVNCRKEVLFQRCRILTMLHLFCIVMVSGFA